MCTGASGLWGKTAKLSESPRRMPLCSPLKGRQVAGTSPPAAEPGGRFPSGSDGVLKELCF